MKTVTLELLYFKPYGQTRLKVDCEGLGLLIVEDDRSDRQMDLQATGALEVLFALAEVGAIKLEGPDWLMESKCLPFCDYKGDYMGPPEFEDGFRKPGYRLNTWDNGENPR